MLQQGEWYKSVPKELKANVRFRLALLEECAKDEDFRRGVMEICKRDFIFWINSFVWQFNPKKKGDESHLATAPFITWECQDEVILDRPETTGRLGILWVYENDRTAVVQKSREMGASWLFLIFQVWLSLFHEGHQTLNISRNEKMVDSKSPDSLFWKIRFIHKWLPRWMTGEIVEEKMHFEYPLTGSFVTGEPSTGAAGVGGRAGTAFIDEFPRIKEDTAVRQGTASTAEARFFNGTHLGTGTEFFKLTITPEIVQIFLHWSQHPEKCKGAYRWNAAENKVDYIDKQYKHPPDYKFDTTGKPVGGPYPGLRSPWYDKKCNDIGSEAGVAQELDINPTGSSSLFFSDVLINNLILRFSRSPTWSGHIKAIHDGDEASYEFVEERDEPDTAPYKLWVNPDHFNRLPVAVYKVAADVSYGTGRTNSCVTILNADSDERVGEYVSPHIYPEDLAPLVVMLCRMLVDGEGRPAELIWETQGPGRRFGIEVQKLGFNRIYYNDNSMGYFDHSEKKIPGWNAETKAKILVLDFLQSCLRNGEFFNFSEPGLKELLKFIWAPDGKKVYHTGSVNKDDPSGAGENHGDRGMADALACWLAKDYRNKIAKDVKPEGPAVYSYEWRKLWANEQRRPERSGIYD